ncbi:MAG: YbaB/EbfC family nucleoid-associated protein [Opitutales bacterium]
MGVGKMMKQLAKVQKQMTEAQDALADEILEISSGGGAIAIQINGQGEFKNITLDPEFLKEDPEFVQETLLAAVQEACEKAKARNEDVMAEIQSSVQMPGMPGMM